MWTNVVIRVATGLTTESILTYRGRQGAEWPQILVSSEGWHNQTALKIELIKEIHQWLPLIDGQGLPLLKIYQITITQQLQQGDL